MARDFSKNTANYMALANNAFGLMINGLSAISVHIWANADTITNTAVANNMLGGTISSGFTGLYLGIDGSGATKVLRAGGRSTAGDALQARTATSSFTTGTWHSCGAVFDYSGDNITPYFNGTAEGGGSVTFSASSYTNSWSSGTDYIGGLNVLSTTTQFDGKLAELAIWTGNIGASNFAALADGADALGILPSSLLCHFRLFGYQSPEYDQIGGRAGTITGTVAKADHPRIIYPQRNRLIYAPAAVASSGAGPILQGRVMTPGRIFGGSVLC